MRISLSSLAVTGISVTQVALASPLIPRKPINSLHGLGDHHNSYARACEPSEKGYGPEVRPDDIGTFKAYKPFAVHNTFPTFLSPSLTYSGASHNCEDTRRL